MAAELILAPSADYRYAVARNVPSTDEQGNHVRIAVCFVEFVNGERVKHAIREDFIRDKAGGDIEKQDQVIGEQLVALIGK